jgi:hypothetical protein
MKGSPLKKKVLKGKLHKQEQWGKPRTRREDVVQRDISQILGI